MLYSLLLAPLMLVLLQVASLTAQPPTPTQSSSPTPEPSPTSTPWVWWWENPDALAISLSTDKQKYKLGDDIMVKIQETNTSDDAIAFNGPGAVLDYDLYISHGVTVMKPYPIGLRSGCMLPFPGIFRGPVLQPGQTLVECGTKGAFTSITGWGLKITEPGVYYLVAISVNIEQHTFPHDRFSDLTQLSNTVQISVDH